MRSRVTGGAVSSCGPGVRTGGVAPFSSITPCAIWSENHADTVRLSTFSASSNAPCHGLMSRGGSNSMVAIASSCWSVTLRTGPSGSTLLEPVNAASAAPGVWK